MMESESGSGSVRRRGLEEYNHNELLEFIKTLRAQLHQQEEKSAHAIQEKEDLRAKALAVVSRCKILESEKEESERHVSILQTRLAAAAAAAASSSLTSSSSTDSFETAGSGSSTISLLEELLIKREADLEHYKSAIEQTVPKMRELKEKNKALRERIEQAEQALEVARAERRTTEHATSIFQIESPRKLQTDAEEEEEEDKEVTVTEAEAATEAGGDKKKKGFSRVSTVGVSNADQELQDLKAQIVRDGETLLEMQGKLETLRATHASQQQASSDRISQLEEQIAIKETKTEKMQTAMQKALEKIKEIKSERDAKAAQVEELLEKVEEASAEQRRLERAHEEEIATTRSHAQEKLDRVQEVEDKKALAEARAADAKNKLTSALASLEEALAHKHTLEQANEALQNSSQECAHQVVSYTIHIAALEAKMAEVQAKCGDHETEIARLQVLNNSLYDKSKQLRILLDARKKVPLVYDILLVCSDGEGGNWCLVSKEIDSTRREVGDGGDDGSDSNITTEITDAKVRVLEWHLQQEVQMWAASATPFVEMASSSSSSLPLAACAAEAELEAESSRCVGGGAIVSAATSGFTIDAQEAPEFPQTVQEILLATFEQEKKALLGQIEAMREETVQSQTLFDTYRERARTSLLKTAADQKAVEGKLTTLNEELVAERNKSAKLEAASSSSLAQLTASLAETEGRLQKEQHEHQEVRKTLTALRAELDAYVEMEEQRLLARSAREADEAASSSSSSSSSSSFSSTFASEEEAEKAIAAQKQLVVDLQEECALIRQREKSLQLEMKKKGDLARSLIKEKDEEVLMWKRKASENSSSSSSSSSSSGSSGSGGSAAVASPVASPSPMPSPSHQTSSSVNSPLESGSGGGIGGGSAILANLIINDEMDAEERKMAILSVFSKEQSRRQHLQAELDEAKKTWKRQEEVLHDRVRELRGEMERAGTSTSSGGGGGGAGGEPNSPTSSSSSSSSSSSVNSNTNTVSLTEREQEYLRQAFVGLFLAKQDKLQLEMQHLGRVLCALLKLSDQQKQEVLERIDLLSTAAVAKESLDSVANFVDLGKYAGFW